LSYYELHQDSLKSIDENITTFLLGYRILQVIGNETRFKEKVEDVKKELEKHWSDKDKNYFKNDLYTLIILLSDKENPHKDEILKTCDILIKDYVLLSVFFMILDEYNLKNEARGIYTDLFERIKREHHEIRDSEKTYVAWILWKYRRLLSTKIKEIRETVLSHILVGGRILDRFKVGVLNLETALTYDLLYDFKKGSRIAFEEVPFIFRFFGVFNGILFIALGLVVDFYFWKSGYLQHSEFLSLSMFINIIIILATMLVVCLSLFLICEVGFKGICANEELKEKLNEWLVQKYFLSVVVGGVILGYVTQLI